MPVLASFLVAVLRDMWLVELLTESSNELSIESFACVRQKWDRNAQEMAQQLELPLPESTTEDFERSWIRFNLVAAAKKWDEAKHLSIVPALLHGKLVEIFEAAVSTVGANGLPMDVVGQISLSVCITGAYSCNWFRCGDPREVSGHCQRSPGGSVFGVQ